MMDAGRHPRIKLLVNTEVEDVNGFVGNYHVRVRKHANYVVTQILRKAWGVDVAANESYSSYADIIGTLECAKQELYRRWVAAYEDKAIVKNGDL